MRDSVDGNNEFVSTGGVNGSHRSELEKSATLLSVGLHGAIYAVHGHCDFTLFGREAVSYEFNDGSSMGSGSFWLERVDLWRQCKSVVSIGFATESELVNLQHEFMLSSWEYDVCLVIFIIFVRASNV